MLAVEGREPFDSDAHLFEIKWDGIRCLAFIEAGRVRLQSRELAEITAQFPELDGLAGLPDGMVLDGELVSVRHGIPCLAAVQRRVQLRNGNRIQLLSRSSPVVYVVFDLLYLHGESIMANPLTERRRKLEEILDDFKTAPVALSEAVLTQGRDLFREVERMGLEGIMAKSFNGRYAPGQRTGLWRKMKPRRTCVVQPLVG
jgi:bifunctional non-homologous end joining protein LigD